MKTSNPITSPFGSAGSRRLATALTGALLGLSLAPPVGAATPQTRTGPPGAAAGPSAAAPAAAAVGKLAPTGCTQGTGTATCDLYAQESTVSVLGQQVPVWGFSTTDAPGTATAPGPVLVVREGDRVTVALHNQLAENVSLAFPGQPAGSFTAGLSATAEETGVATGGTATYTFTASRPGTFLYEAGHTPGGARQVAMGLAGALVVLAADGTANGRAYDDEAVVVLSEIDPELNAHPLAFDMRHFRPRYRLINGRPFPSTSPIATDQGHTVLLRYVNVGSLTHPMSLLGATQVQVARDGHPMDHAETEVVAAVESGATADTLVSMPSGPEAKVTLFEAGSHLDNAGQTEADPTRVAFGGMLTFLDTNAPPPVDDLVGPVPAHVKVSPNPSDGLTDVTVTADLSDASTGGNPVTNAEFVVDDPVGTAVGGGVPMGPDSAFGTVAVTGVSGTLPAVPADGASCTPTSGPVPLALSCLAAGKHIVYVRGQDAANNWGVIKSAVLNLPKVGPATRGGSADPDPSNGSKDVVISATGDDSAASGVIDQAEFFVDTVGASGTGTGMTLNRQAAVVAEDGVLPAQPPGTQTCATFPAAVSCLVEGQHHVFVHSHDRMGLWGPVLDIPISVDRTGPAVDVLEVAPNPTNGVLSSVANPGYLVVSAVLTDRDASSALQSRVARVEGFLDPTGTPAPGTGFDLVATDGKLDTSSESVYGLIPISQVRPLANGTHHVLVRGKDAAGNWGTLQATDLVVDKTAPALQSMTASPNPTNGADALVLTAPVANDTLLGAAEFWTGSTDPGVGKATRLQVSLVNGAAVVTVPLTGIPSGQVTFHLRVQDRAGNWSNAVATTATVTKPNAVFSDTFDSGDLSAWAQRTGPTAALGVTGAAGIPPTAGNQGLQLTLPGDRANRAAYVTDTSPVAEPGYHVRFALDPHTMASGTAAAITLLDARTAGGSAFSLQFRRSGTSRQVRALMSRSQGRPLTGAWQTLPAGAPVVQLDWTAGPATGPTAGSLRLTVGGAPAGVLTGNTNTLRVESVRLGIVSGFATSSAGTAYVDSFVSTRYTLP